MKQPPMRIIQISDLHLMADIEGALLGVKTQESFQAVLDLIQREEKTFDMMLLSGDLSQDGSAMAYQRLAQMLNVLHVPVYFVPGNHDDAKMLAHVYPLESISNHKHIVLRNWHLILLDSHVQKQVHGYLDPSQLDYLQHCLQAYPEHQAIIVFHHHPMPVGSSWLDPIGLRNADEFWQIISSYPKVNTILFGHIHQEFEQEMHNVKCYALPSTCIQFHPKQDKFGLIKLAPGYRWMNLYDDGCMETEIKRTAEYVGTFDANAKGY